MNNNKTNKSNSLIDRKIVLLRGVNSINLGDDLFFKIVFDRYPDALFLVLAPKVYKQIFADYKNVKIINNSITLHQIPIKVKTVINRLIKYIQYIYIFMRYRIDVSLIVGGSIFMEHSSGLGSYIKGMSLIKKIFNKLKIVILGCNFGPYQSEEFKKRTEFLLMLTDDVCFRDSVSFNLFSKIPSVRMGNDIVLNIDKIPYSRTEKLNIVGINLRNVDNWPSLVDYKKAYISKAVELIEYFRNLGYKILMISFCKQYGDEKIINEVIDKLKDRSGINIYTYRGNINEALKIISSIKYMIATRFHAIILGFLYNIKVLPIAYSNKTKDMLKTYGLWKEQYDLGVFSYTDLSTLLKLFIEHFEIEEKMNVQFKYLDTILK